MVGVAFDDAILDVGCTSEVATEGSVFERWAEKTVIGGERGGCDELSPVGGGGGMLNLSLEEGVTAEGKRERREGGREREREREKERERGERANYSI